MSLSNELLHSGAGTIRVLVEKTAELQAKLAAEEDLKSAIATLEILVKAGRLEDSDEPIVKRAETLLAAENYAELTKQAESGNLHIDMEMFGDLDIGPPRKKSASSAKEIEVDTKHNSFHRELLGVE